MTKTTKDWVLPAPPKEEGDEWLPVVRIGKHIPFGYRQDPEDCDILLPIKKELDLLEKAKKLLKSYSYREVANWLSQQSGRYISNEGLRKRVKIESKRQREAANARLYAEKAQRASKKAAKLAERIGRKAPKSDC